MAARVSVTVKPRSRNAGVRLEAGEVVIAVREPAIDGRATEACRAALARAAAVPLRSVTLQSGVRSRHKIFRVEGIDEVELFHRLCESSGGQ
jgi:uncharacterized protein YggU (UPF0235/DUF167 family)